MQKKKPSAKQLAARAKFTKMVKARAAKSKAAKNKKLGALPVGFSGSVYGVNFKVINQYSIYNDVSAIVEDKKNGNTIVVFDGIGNAVSKADTMASYIIKNTTSFTNETDKKQLKSRLLKFCANMQMEVKNFNAGKKKTIKKRPLVITKPIKLIKKAATKKQATKKHNKQTGTSNRAIDIKIKALRPGKRISENGNVYYERRKNKSDKGRLLGISKICGLPKYKDPIAAREIELYATNDNDLYRQQRRPILINLGKKHKKGLYKIDLAAKLWRYFIDTALKKYNKDFGSRGDKWYEILDISDRQLLAEQFAMETKDEFDLGNYTEQ